MLVLPMFAEQPRNAMLVLRLNIGGVINKFLFSKKYILKEINNILFNLNYYVKRITKIKQIMLDKPINDFDDELFYINRLIKKSKIHKTKAYNSRSIENKLFFRRKGIDLYFVEYIFYEIIFVFILLLIFLEKQ